MEKLVLENLYKIVVPLFGAAYAAPNKGTTIFNDLGVINCAKATRLLSDFPVLFKTDLTFKDFSRKLSNFKYFSSLCKTQVLFKPVQTLKVYQQTPLGGKE